MTRRYDDHEGEIRDRVRRIETRLTKYMQSQGFDTEGKRTVWDERGVIHAPSPDVTLRECIAAIPEGYENDVPVCVKGDVFCYVGRP